MNWPSDIVQVLALLVTSAGVGAASIALARVLRLDRLLRYSRPDGYVQATITTLAALADDAKRNGILSIEERCGSLDLPCARRGVELLSQGKPVHEVRSTLLDELDSFVLTPRPRTWAAALGLVGVAGMAAACVAALMLAGTREGNSLLVGLAGVAIPAAVLLTIASRALDLSGRVSAARMLEGLLVIEAVCLIGGGRDGAAVREALGSAMPTARPVRAVAA